MGRPVSSLPGRVGPAVLYSPRYPNSFKNAAIKPSQGYSYVRTLMDWSAQLSQELSDALLELTNLADRAAARLAGLDKNSVEFRMVGAELESYDRAIDALMRFRKTMDSEFQYTDLS